MSLEQEVARASKWSALSEWGPRAITPVVFVVLARLLAPEDFGVVAAAALVISFSQVLWDAGMSKALVQRAAESPAAANVAFWVNVGLGLLVYLVLFFAAGLIAGLFDDPRVAPVVRVQGLQVILLSLNATHLALYQRQLEFRPLFWIRLLSSVLPGLASIPLALAGASYWALVGGTLLGTLVQVVAVWRLSPWRPRPEFDLATAREMLGFGAWSTLEGLLGWFYLWGDTFVVGAFLNSADMGLYRTGNTFVTMVFTLLLAPLQPVLFSAFSRLQGDPGRLVRALRHATKATCLVAMPIGVGAFVLGEAVAPVAFGEQWVGIGAVLAWMGLTQGVAWIVGANASAYRAVRRPDVNVKIMAAAVVYYLPVYLLTAPLGLEVFLVARFAVAVASIPIHLYVAQRLLGLSWRAHLAAVRWIVGAALVAAICVWLAEGRMATATGPFVHLVALGLIGVAAYAVLLFREWGFVSRLATTFLARGAIR